MNTKDIFDILPRNIKTILDSLKNYNLLQEIRIKVNKPLLLNIGNREKIFEYKPNTEDLKFILQKISNYSIYAFEDEIKQGYITIKGGHRVGLCGNCVVENESVKTIKDINSVNIRVCREVKGCSDFLMPYILDGININNTIIISPPKCGKTTLLRDITRNLSEGVDRLSYKGKNISVVDERSEIGACYKGIPQLDIGIRSDILDNCPKSQGIMMAIRSMAPEVIVCDEIGTYKDMESIMMALNSGVNLITTIHGFDIEDLYKREVFKDVMANFVFKIAIVLSNRKGVCTIEYIYDFTKGKELWRYKDA